MASVSYVDSTSVPKAPGPTSSVGSKLGGLVKTATPFVKAAVGDEVRDLARDKIGGKTGAAVGQVLTGGVNNLGGNLAKAAGAFASDKLKGTLDKLQDKKGFQFLLKALGIGDPGSTEYQKLEARADPQMVFDFFVIMPTLYIPGGGSVSLPNEYVEDIDIPFESVAIDETFRAGRMLKTAGVLSVSDFTLKFYGEHKHFALRYLETWKHLIQDNNGVHNLPYKRVDGQDCGYCKPIIIGLMDDTRTPVITAELIGTFPSNRGPFSMLSNSNDRVIPDATFACSGVNINFDPNGASSSTDAAGPFSGGFNVKSVTDFALKTAKGAAIEVVTSVGKDLAKRRPF